MIELAQPFVPEVGLYAFDDSWICTQSCGINGI